MYVRSMKLVSCQVSGDAEGRVFIYLSLRAVAVCLLPDLGCEMITSKPPDERGQSSTALVFRHLLRTYAETSASRIFHGN